MTPVAIENGHLWWINPLNVVIFHSYISLPEGNAVVQIAMSNAIGIYHYHELCQPTSVCFSFMYQWVSMG